MRSPATTTAARVRQASPLDELRAAIATLTRIPVPGVRADVAGAGAFGLVGAVLGLVASVPLALLAGTGTLIGPVLAVVVLAVLTGAFHLDGLADTADALIAIGPLAAERARKDPSLGTGGGVALISILALDVAALESVVRLGGPLLAVATCVVAGAASRAIPVLISLAARRGAARGEGMGARFAASVTPLHAFVATATAAILAGLAIPVAGPVPIAALVIGSAVGGVLSMAIIRLRRQLDGDALGASVELAFASIVVAAGIAASIVAAA